jgi:co-chaperonin GroES (HSP10)
VQRDRTTAPLDGWIAVALDDASPNDGTVASGRCSPRAAVGIVVATGRRPPLGGVLVPHRIRVGDTVVFSATVGTLVHDGANGRFRLLPEQAVAAIIPPRRGRAPVTGVQPIDRRLSDSDPEGRT